MNVEVIGKNDCRSAAEGTDEVSFRSAALVGATSEKDGQR